MISLRGSAAAVTLTSALVGLAAQAPSATAEEGLGVITNFSAGQTVHPGDVVFVDVSVSTPFDRGTTAPITIDLASHRGRVIGFADLGYPVDCTASQGRGHCVTEGPVGAGHGFELSVEVKVGGHGTSRHGRRPFSVTTLTAFAQSKPDGLKGMDTVGIKVTRPSSS